MSAKASNWAWSQKVSPAEAIVLQALADEADDLGICGTQSVAALSRKCGIPVRTLHRVLKFLKSTGRLFIHQQWSPEGLQVPSRFELNLDRPGDTEFAPRRYARCIKDGAPEEAASRRRTDKLAVASATLAQPDSSSSAILAQRISDDSANLAEPGANSPASSAQRATHGSATSGGAHPEATTVVVTLDNQQQQPGAEFHQHGSLVRRLQEEVCLGSKQVHQLRRAYSDDHLGAALAYVVDRHQRGLIQPGKIAGYFLSVVRNATPESLALSARIDEPPAAITTAEELAAAGLDAAKQEANRQALRATEAKWNALPTTRQEAVRAEFMAHLARDNPIVHAVLRGKSDGLSHRLLLQWLADQERCRDSLSVTSGGSGDE